MYQEIKKAYATGWNTWDVRSVCSHVRMPEGVCLNLGFKDYVEREPLTELNLGFDLQDLYLGPHAYDGSYTEVVLKNWGAESHVEPLSFRIESAHVKDDLVVLVEPVDPPKRLKAPRLTAELCILWNRPGTVTRDAEVLEARVPNNTIRVFATGVDCPEYYVGAIRAPYISLCVDQAVGLSTGKKRGIDEIREVLAEQRGRWEVERDGMGEHAESWEAIQTVLAWNVLYEPQHDRVVCPVSRRWSLRNRGYVLYLWDTYFAAYQAAATGSKELAYTNLVEMTQAKHKAGRPFVPNVEQANGFLSRDRSQPPVGSLCAKEVYRVFREKWILELLYPDLLEWNEWWNENRRHEELLCYGSTPYEPVVGNKWETEEGEAVNGWFGASMESGWDGGVLYRGVPFDKKRHILKHWDASLNGLYVLDCRALADIADVLCDSEAAKRLRARADKLQESAAVLWNERTGFFHNKNWETGEFSDVVAINGFYPLLSRTATDEQARRVAQDYLLSPDQFWGNYAPTTLARSNPVFGDKKEYWDGRVWPPVSFLVYLGLRNYLHLPEVADAACRLVENSRKLILREFRDKRLVRENYDVETGSGDESNASAAFYHWGGLLALMSFVHDGVLAPPETPL